MNDDQAIEKRKGLRGSSPPHIPPEEPRDDRPHTETRKARDEQRWTIWQAAYRLRRLDAFLGIMRRALKGRT